MRRVSQNIETLTNSLVIPNVCEESQHKNMRFFLPEGRQNDKMIVKLHFDTPSTILKDVKTKTYGKEITEGTGN